MQPQNNAFGGQVMRGIAFTKYGARAASTRQRLLQFLPALEAQGITLEISSLFDNDYLDALMESGKRPVLPMLRAYMRRLRALLRAGEYDFIWVHYELFPYLPGSCERLARLSGKPVIYDCDDATFHLYDQHPNPLVRRVLAGKLAPLLRGCALAVCGNAYLAEYVSRYCRNMVVIPTVVDVTRYAVATRAPQAPPVIGWMGSPSTWSYGAAQAGVLSEFAATGQASILVVGAGPAANPALPFTFRDWTEETEVADLQAMDIGIMPQPDEAWARGKCGYKLIQYIACGLPVVASPVGVNTQIVQHGVNGFLATTQDEWREALNTLVGDAALRARMGAAGRARVVADYSLQRYGAQLAKLFATHGARASSLASPPSLELE